MSLATTVALAITKIDELVGLVKGQYTKWDGQVKAQIEKLDNWYIGTRKSFLGTEVVDNDFTSTFSIASSYGDSGSISSEVGVLKHIDNAVDYKPTESCFYIGDEKISTLPLHPVAKDKRAIFQVGKVLIQDTDASRNFYLKTGINLINPFSDSSSFFSHGSFWIYVSRDIDINLIFACVPEYPAIREYYVDGVKHTGKINRGWHEITAFNEGGKVAYSNIDIMRFNFTNNDSLQDVEIYVTHVALQVNTELSSVIKKLGV